MDDNVSEDGAIEIEGIPGWERRLTRRGKLRRMGIAALAVLVALGLVFSLNGGWQDILATLPFGTASAGDMPTPAPLSLTAHAPQQLAAGPWSQVALPIAGGAILSYAASPVDPSTLYLCASAIPIPNGPDGQNDAVPLRIWRTRDSGRHWQTLSLPAISDTGCYIHVAADAPARLALLLTNAANNRESCADVQVFLSDDGGAHWQETPHAPPAPRSVSASYCDVAVTAQHLYFLHAYETVQGTNDHTQVSQIERSDDGGKTWISADNGLPQNTLFFPTVVGDGHVIITTVLPGNAATTFWMTSDAGRSWQRMSPMPSAGVDTVLGSAPAGAVSGGQQTFYGILGDQVPDLYLRAQIFESVGGAQWAALPPLPVTGASASRTGITETLGVAPDGSLFAFGVAPQDGVPAEGTEAPLKTQWLWQWQPQAQRWGVAPSPLPRPSPQDCGARCWSAQFSSDASGTYLWVLSWGADQALYRLRVS